MFFKILLQYLLGYVNIRVEGYFIEKFINKSINRKIFLWNIKRNKSTIITTNVGIKDFKKLVKIAKETKCRVKILYKKGFPFLLHRYKKRKIFFLLIILVIISMFVISKFVWNINIEGLYKIDKNEIKTMLEQKGLKIGTLKNNINTQKIINEIRLERNDISWIGIDIEGTNVTVKIVEADNKPQIIDDQDYCNIVADKDAQIVKISAQNGIMQVKEGDIVTKGDILIAGWIEGKYTGTRYVHANGEVKGKVWYTETVETATNQIVEELTGNEENKYKIKINNFEINFFKTLSNFEKYDTIEEKKKFKIFSNLYLPIEIVKITNKEKIEKQIVYDTETAKQMGIEQASNKIEEQLPENVEILNKYIDHSQTGNITQTKVTYEVLENIGTKEKIVF